MDCLCGIPEFTTIPHDVWFDPGEIRSALSDPRNRKSSSVLPSHNKPFLKFQTDDLNAFEYPREEPEDDVSRRLFDERVLQSRTHDSKAPQRRSRCRRCQYLVGACELRCERRRLIPCLHCRYLNGMLCEEEEEGCDSAEERQRFIAEVDAYQRRVYPHMYEERETSFSPWSLGASLMCFCVNCSFDVNKLLLPSDDDALFGFQLLLSNLTLIFFTG